MGGGVHADSEIHGHMPTIAHTSTQNTHPPNTHTHTPKMHTQEEEAAETRGAGEQQEDAGDEFSNYGHLARAYLMGYSCNTEAELQRVFGVKLR